MLYSVFRDSSCDWHRINNPINFMNIPKSEKPGQSKIYFFNRIPSHPLEEIKKRGIKIVCDIDDFWHLPKNHYLYNLFEHGGMTKKIIDSLKIADVVLTTHSKLADKVKEFNKNVHVVPNAIPYDKGQFNIGKQKFTGKTAFIGGMSHYKDIDLIKGYSVPNQLHISRYMDHYKGVNLCLAPLEDNEFNSLKSNLKTLEAACGHAAIICSDMHPFRNNLDDEFVIYAKSNEWQSKIKYCHDNPEYVKEMGEKLAEHCRKHYDLIKVNETRKDIFSELLRIG